jgi:hypothetical protein
MGCKKSTARVHTAIAQRHARNKDDQGLCCLDYAVAHAAFQLLSMIVRLIIRKVVMSEPAGSLGGEGSFSQ